MLVLPRVANETSRDYATRVIRENIIQLNLAPGAMVSENELSTALDLSRTPIREALIELSKVGIIEILPQRGSRIAMIDYNLVNEARSMRLVLEQANVKTLCAQGLTSEQYNLLGENLSLQRFYMRDITNKRIFELDEQFHKQLFAFANCEITHQLAKTFNVHFDRIRNMSVHAEETFDAQLVEDHAQIVESIVAKDPERASRTIAVHLSRYQVHASHIRKHYAEYVKN